MPPVPAGRGAPGVRLLDAGSAHLDPTELRRWARGVTERTGALCTSRSYRYPYALVSWHSHPIGVDIERITTWEPAFADLICTEPERRHPACRADPDRYLTSLWCSKEALAKALGDARRYEPSRLESPTGWPPEGSGPWRAAPIGVAPGFVAWLCWQQVDVDSNPGGRSPTGRSIPAVP